MIEIFQIDSDREKYYVLLETTEQGDLVLSELTLDGRSSAEFVTLPSNSVKLASNPSLPWKAAYMVWKNASFLQQIETKKENRYREKLIELLALKHGVDPKTLSKIIEELDELEG